MDLRDTTCDIEVGKFVVVEETYDTSQRHSMSTFKRQVYAERDRSIPKVGQHFGIIKRVICLS